MENAHAHTESSRLIILSTMVTEVKNGKRKLLALEAFFFIYIFDFSKMSFFESQFRAVAVSII